LKADPHFENDTTWEIIHYNIVQNREAAPIFYFFFNEFDLNEFTRNDVEFAYRNFLLQKEVDAPDRSISDDVTVLFNSYINGDLIRSSDNTQLDFEDISVCPLFRLNALEIQNPRSKTYSKKANMTLSNEAIAKILVSALQQKNLPSAELQLSDVIALMKPFNFDRLHTISRLTELDKKGVISFDRTAGLDTIRGGQNA
jgi:hypothetical protein